MRVLPVKLGLLLLLGLVILWPALDLSESQGATYEPTSITEYDADFRVADDGDLDVVETITVDFPISGRHGIFRFWDVRDPNAPQARRIPADIDVTMDGQDVEQLISRQGQGRYRVVRVGSENITVTPGLHTYRISYRIPGVLIDGGGTGAESEFAWNLIPGGWQQAIGEATLSVTLPTEAVSASCDQGAGASGGCEVSGVGTRTLVVTTGNLPPRTPVTVRAGLDLPTPPPGRAVPWPARFDGVVGQHVAIPFVAGVLAIRAMLAGVILAGRTREPTPPFPLQYAPPEGVGPAQGL